MRVDDSGAMFPFARKPEAPAADFRIDNNRIGTGSNVTCTVGGSGYKCVGPGRARAGGGAGGERGLCGIELVCVAAAAA